MRHTAIFHCHPHESRIEIPTSPPPHTHTYHTQSLRRAKRREGVGMIRRILCILSLSLNPFFTGRTTLPWLGCPSLPPILFTYSKYYFLRAYPNLACGACLSLIIPTYAPPSYVVHIWAERDHCCFKKDRFLPRLPLPFSENETTN